MPKLLALQLIGIPLRSDLQIVPSPCTAREALALTVRHLKSLGIPFPHDIVRCTVQGLVSAGNSFFIYADVTDAGPDQSLRRKLMRSALADVPHILYLDGNCLMHQYHLIVKESLVLIDSFLQSLLREPSFDASSCRGGVGFSKYFASNAKIANYWRERVDEFIKKYEAIHEGAAKSGVQYRRYPLRVVGGRWGSIDQAEHFYLQRGKKLLQPVLMSMLSSAMKADKSGKVGRGEGDDGHEDVTCLQDDEEERQSYQIRMSKWAKGALATIQSDLYWVLLRVAYQARAPLRHFFLWMQKHTDDNLLLRLVTNKAEEIRKEFDELLVSFDHWFASAVQEADAKFSDEFMALVKDLALRLVLAGAGGFELRVRSQCEKLLVLQNTLLDSLSRLESCTLACMLCCGGTDW